MDIKIPFLGDGIESAVVLSILVKPGDSVQLDDTILELETDKAVAPVPATQAGTITTITVSEGATVREGMSIGSLTTRDGDKAPAKQTPDPSVAAIATPVSNTPAPVVSTTVAHPVASVSPGALGTPGGATSPVVRQMAHQLGIDLSRVIPTNNRVTIRDLRRYIAQLQTPASTSPDTSGMPDFAKWGPVTKEPLSSLRSKIAAKMTAAWQVPHVTQFHTCDVTELMARRKTHNPDYKAQGTNLTITSMAVVAAISALKAFPLFNSTLDTRDNVIIRKSYYNIGIAVETPAGLIVPVIHDADSYSVFELSRKITELAEKARNRSLGTADLQGGTFTISNLGGLGVGPFTPIINTPEVAIMGLGRGVNHQQPLALSYDHRVIDGADGARFMTHFATTLCNLDNLAADTLTEALTEALTKEETE